MKVAQLFSPRKNERKSHTHAAIVPCVAAVFGPQYFVNDWRVGAVWSQAVTSVDIDYIVVKIECQY